MLRLLVIDDEALIRRGIANKVMKISADYIVEEAEDADEALSKITAFMPDIIITDIKMPGLSGLEFIEAAVNIQPSLRFIVVSGYEDFSYAQKAIKLGVSDYLLKPVNNEELRKAIAKMEESVKEENEQQAYIAELRRKASANMIQQKNTELSKALPMQECNSADMNKVLAVLDFQPSQPLFTAAAIKLIFEDDAAIFPDASLMRFAISNIIEEVLNEKTKALVFEHLREEEAIGAIINHNLPEGALKALLNITAAKVSEYLKVKLIIGVGHAYPGPEGLKDSFLQAYSALQQGITYESETVIFHKKEKDKPSSQYLIGEEDERLITGHLEQGNEKQLKQYFDDMLDKLGEQKSPGRLRTFLYDFLLLLHKTLRQNGFEADTEAEQIFEKGQGIGDYRKMIYKQIEDACTLFTMRKEYPGKKIVTEIIEQIGREYYKEIKLSNLAKQYYLNQSYLCQLFYDNAGMNFSQYLRKVRMEKAMELLRTTDFPAGKIAELVGYPERSYFTNVFKTYTGVSPGEYRTCAQAKPKGGAEP